ncbi:MAG: magnesium transporter [Acidimicrobiia bacterium]|nr:magnesium transporter [Acidimicrobiia bacterium]
MKLRLRRPRDFGLALRELARRRPREAEEYLDTHQAQFESLAEADPHDAADVLEAIDEEAAAEIIVALDLDHAADVLEEMRHEAAADVLEELPAESAAPLIAELPADEAADIVGHLDAATRTEVFEHLEESALDGILELLAYPPDSAGGLMSTDIATLPGAIAAGEAIESLRRLHQHVEDLSYVYVVDDAGRLIGVVSFRELVFARPGDPLDEVMIPDPVAVRTETDREEVAELIRRYNYRAMPVVDHRGVLRGMVVIDDVIDAVQREATEDIAAMVGAGADETVFTPVGRSVRSRLPWIVVNLGTIFLVAIVVSWFEPIIDELAVLAAYMPVVASVGGNSGAQSQAVVIRAMAVETLPAQWARRVIWRSTVVGVINGIAIGIVSGIIAGGFTGETRIGIVIAISAFANMVIANVAGAGIPVALDRMGQDAALASNIFLTLVTDLVGFGGFLAIATLLL